jgi:glycerophosphoryl diester phosphodiesterase
MRFADDPRGQSGFRVAEFMIDEVKSLDAGSWFVAERGARRSASSFGTLCRLEPAWIEHCRSGNVTVPTLAEALIFTREHAWLANIELKSFPEGSADLVEPVLDVIERTRTADRVLISSFDHNDIARANRSGRGYALGVLTLTPLYRLAAYAAELVGADAVCASKEVLGSESARYRASPSAGTLRAPLVADVKSRAIPLLVYTVNEHGTGSLAEHLAAIGVDGLITDDPLGMIQNFEAQRA